MPPFLGIYIFAKKVLALACTQCLHGDLAPGVRAHGCEVAGGGGRLPLPRLVVVTPDVQAPQSRAQVAVGRGARARG